jgi:site-specific recombinase XerD
MRIKTSKTGVYYTVVKDGDKIFSFSYKDQDGKKHWVKVGSYKDGFRIANAVELRNEQIAKMKHGKDIRVVAQKKKKTIVTFDDLAQKYFKDKNSTQNRMSRYNIHIKDIIGNKDITKIDRQNIESLLDEVEIKGLSNQTINSTKELISTIFNHHIKNYQLKITNPCMGIAKRKVDNARERYLTLEEIEQLKEIIKDDFLISLFVDLSLQTGGRFETILTIQKKDVNLQQKTVTLKNHKAEKTYTGFLQDEVIETLREYMKQLNINDYLISFEAKHNEKLTQRHIQHRIKPILDELFNQGLDTKDAKNRVVVHTFRHTFASHLAIKGVPIFTIKELMNHAKIDQTLRYAKLSPQNGKDAVQGLYQ